MLMLILLLPPLLPLLLQGCEIGQQAFALMSPTQRPYELGDGGKTGNLLTMFLTGPLMAFCLAAGNTDPSIQQLVDLQVGTGWMDPAAGWWLPVRAGVEYLLTRLHPVLFGSQENERRHWPWAAAWLVACACSSPGSLTILQVLWAGSCLVGGVIAGAMTPLPACCLDPAAVLWAASLPPQ